MNEIGLLRMREQENEPIYNSNYNSNNERENNERFANQPNTINDLLDREFGLLSTTAWVMTDSSEDYIMRFLNVAADIQLGMPVEDNLVNVVSFLIQRLILKDDLPMTVFDAVLTRFPEIVAENAADPGNHILSNILAAILEENQKESPFNRLIYPEHPNIQNERLIEFLEYLRNRTPSITPGYEFFIACVRYANRDVLAYLLENQLSYVREMFRLVETKSDTRLPEGISEATLPRLALEARKHLLHILPSTRRRRGGRRSSRRGARRDRKTRRRRRRSLRKH